MSELGNAGFGTEDYTRRFMAPAASLAMDNLEIAAITDYCRGNLINQLEWDLTHAKWQDLPGISEHVAEVGARVAFLNKVNITIDYDSVLGAA